MQGAGNGEKYTIKCEYEISDTSFVAYIQCTGEILFKEMQKKLQEGTPFEDLHQALGKGLTLLGHMLEDNNPHAKCTEDEQKPPTQMCQFKWDIVGLKNDEEKLDVSTLAIVLVIFLQNEIQNKKTPKKDVQRKINIFLELVIAMFKGQSVEEFANQKRK